MNALVFTSMAVKVMKEIRLRWVAGEEHIATESAPRRPCGGLWRPDSPENRETLQNIVEAAIEAYGPGSHWIEEREA
ncbi:hypothetical protein [Variovorax guangxiensis]|jgi:hypothetical protein|uniref:hypothetical protein n=1 Tax=Variovorax guangxiensis TaxID=1775474 RepID=UPI002857E809|nr:hypothetical protein [Variovorax guangxiensis]MDR6858104.1 hypothetical protein [Variovorax guangxiensis]